MRLNPWVVAGGVGAVVLLLSRKAVAQVGVAVVEGIKEDLKTKRIVDTAEEYKIPPAVALAIADVESSGGSGFSKTTGKMIIRFEPHIFRNQTEKITGKRIDPPLFQRGGQKEEWAMFDAAAAVNREAAIKSISMGMFQVMGFNHKLVGYPNAESMFQAYSTDQKAQIKGFFEFCTKVKSNEKAGSPDIRLDEAARKGLWTVFARGYNGKGQVGYDSKMKKRYEVWVKQGYKGIA